MAAACRNQKHLSDHASRAEYQTKSKSLTAVSTGLTINMYILWPVFTTEFLMLRLGSYLNGPMRCTRPSCLHKKKIFEYSTLQAARYQICGSLNICHVVLFITVLRLSTEQQPQCSSAAKWLSLPIEMWAIHHIGSLSECPRAFDKPATWRYDRRRSAGRGDQNHHNCLPSVSVVAGCRITPNIDVKDAKRRRSISIPVCNNFDCRYWRHIHATRLLWCHGSCLTVHTSLFSSF